MRSATTTPRRSAVTAGLLTAVSLSVVAGTAALAGAILARKFGRGPETDGFFASYSVYVLLLLAATATRVVVLPTLARAARAGHLAEEAAGYVLAFALPVAALLIVSTFASSSCAHLLVGNLPGPAEQTAAQALVWLVPAASAQLFAGLAASSLAALDDYETAAFAFAGGAVTALLVFASFADAHGPVALAWGLATGGFLSLGILLIRFVRHRGLRSLDRVNPRVVARLRESVDGVSVPLALQGLYVIALRFAANLGLGRVTSFSYAYLVGAALVSVAASPLALVSTVPLTRRALDDEQAAVHVVAMCWLALTIVPGAAGVFAVAGGRILLSLLGRSYGGVVGADLGRLVVYLSPWMIASVGVAVSLPLLFVAMKQRLLPALGLGAVVAYMPLAWLGSGWFGLAGLASVITLITIVVLMALLATLSLRTLALVVPALGLPALFTTGVAVVSFFAAGKLFEPIKAAVLGLLLYGGILSLARPSGLRAAWDYIRALQ